MEFANESKVIWIENLRRECLQILQPYDSWGMLSHLLLNQALNPELETLLRELGFVHLLSAAGIHLYGWADGIRGLFSKLGQSAGLRADQARHLAVIVCLASSLVLWGLQDFRLGFIRPLLIVGMRLLAERWGFRWRLFAPLILALVIDFVLGWNSSEFASIARWHYALAVGGGLLAWEASRGRPTWLRHLALSVGSWLLTVPLGLGLHSRFAPWTPLISLLFIPFVTVFVFPATVIGLALRLCGDQVAAPFLLSGVGWSLQKSVGGLSSLLLKINPIWMVSMQLSLVAAVLAWFCIAVFKTLRARVFFLVGCVFLCRMIFNAPPSQAVVQLNVGQGDSALVLGPAPGLIDAGPPRHHALNDWLDVFSSEQVDRLDWILLSHLDLDHVGGVDLLSRVFQVGCIQTSRAEWKTPRGEKWKKNIESRDVITTNELGLPCVLFPVLAPLNQSSEKNGQMNGIVVSLPHHWVYVNFGDASSEQEDEFLKRIRSQKLLDPNSKILLKISHHGSWHSSSEGFLRSLHPDHAWISVGRNRYGHPAALTLERLRKLQIPFERTDRSGNLNSRKISMIAEVK